MWWICWPVGQVMRICHTKGMRNVLILVMCATAWAQPSTSPSNPPPAKQDDIDKDIVIPVNVNVVIAPTTVRDHNGNFINGLQLQDFQLYDNNKLQRITADVRDEPLSLVIAVQKSANL